MTRKSLKFACGILLVSTACVSTGTYQAKERELADTRAQLTMRDQNAAAERARLTQELDKLNGELHAMGRKLASASYERDTLRDVRDNDLALLAQLKKRLDAVGQDVQTLTQEKGLLASSMAEAMARMHEVDRLKAVADARAASYRDLVERLQAMISAGSLEVVLRHGRMLIILPNDVLFDSGRTEVKSDARAALKAVAQAIMAQPERRLTVVGHTDDKPIHTARFRSNWDLSTARAVEVTLFLVGAGVPPERVAAAGHAEFDPVAANDSEPNRKLNRRVEVELEPNITELPGTLPSSVSVTP